MALLRDLLHPNDVIWRPATYPGVICYEGFPGSYKSGGLAEWMADGLLAGEECITNEGFVVTVKMPDGTTRSTRTIKSFQELADVRGPARIGLDELPMWVAARNWQEFPDGMMQRFTQVRKDAIQLRYTAIDELMVDKVVRDITAYTYQCRHVSGPIFCRRLVKPVKLRKSGENAFRVEWFLLRKSRVAVFDTMSKVDAPEERSSRGGRKQRTQRRTGGGRGGPPQGVPDASVVGGSASAVLAAAGAGNMSLEQKESLFAEVQKP